MRAQVWDPALVLLLVKLNEVTLLVWPWFFFLSSVQLLPGPKSFLAMEELLNAEDGMIVSPKLLGPALRFLNCGLPQVLYNIQSCHKYFF